jgi:hypothetical protein
LPLLFAKYSTAEKRQHASGRTADGAIEPAPFTKCLESSETEIETDVPVFVPRVPLSKKIDCYQTKSLDRRGDEKNSAQPSFPVPVNFPSPLIKGTLQLPNKGFCPFLYNSEGLVRGVKMERGIKVTGRTAKCRVRIRHANSPTSRPFFPCNRAWLASIANPLRLR